MRRVWWIAALAACTAKSSGSHGNGDHAASAIGPTGSAADDGGGAPLAPTDDATLAIALPPAPPAPPVPLGLPANDAAATLSPDAIALGELLFFDPRVSASGTTSCASCHDPDHGWADLRARATTDAGQPDLRRTPAIANLLWQTARGGFAWDGRYDTLATLVGAHWKGQLGLDAVHGVEKIAANPTYAAHFARQPGAPIGDAQAAAAADALAAYVASRYQGDAPWDRYERGDKNAVSGLAASGYAVFTGKAQCSVCHVPPLYTDGGYHAIGLIKQADEGRGRVDPAARGAFKTPTLRGAALHAPYFHDGSAATLEAAIDWHTAGGVGQGADRSIIDPALAPIALTPDERAQLIAFVRALSPAATAPPYHRPEMPK